MANHKSAKKRNRQTLKRTNVNRSLMSKIKNNISDFNKMLSNKESAAPTQDLQKSLSIINSFLAKAVKKGLIKKKFASRKLSSLSNQLK